MAVGKAEKSRTPDSDSLDEVFGQKQIVVVVEAVATRAVERVLKVVQDPCNLVEVDSR